MPMLHRMNKLKELFKLRVGPGAATLPRDVVRIHLLFAQKINNGHFGPRVFWHDYLPRLKYYNPGVSMTVERTEDQQSPATMQIYFGRSSFQTSAAVPDNKTSSSPKQHDTTTSSSSHKRTGDIVGGPASATTLSGSERVETVDIQHKKEQEIYEQLLSVTNGKVVEPTAAERDEVARLEQEAIDKAIDSKKKKAVMHKMREEARIEQQMREAAKASAG